MSDELIRLKRKMDPFELNVQIFAQYLEPSKVAAVH
jgi:hypothetical protein